MKQVIIVRNDLDISVGKMIAQACHASVKAYLDSGVDGYRDKIVVGCDKETLLKKAELCKDAGVRHNLVRDAGRTELQPHTVTALAVGPADDDSVDSVTGDLPLLNNLGDER